MAHAQSLSCARSQDTDSSLLLMLRTIQVGMAEPKSRYGSSHTSHTASATLGGVVRMYDSLYKTLSKETVYLIASMVHILSSDLNIVMMDVEKQSNGSDCVVLAIAYVFDICRVVDPCTVRFDHSKIRLHLATCLENCQVSRFPILGERVSVQRK